MTNGAGFATVLVAALLVLPAHAQQGPTQAELNAASGNSVDWLYTNHDYGGQRLVDVTAITRDNARSLRPTCRYELGDLYSFHTNPIVYRGVMYLTTTYATIALDAVTCRVRWRHDWQSKAPVTACARRW
jgi:alcohol dehydrogenase (cytochrome c)